MQANMNVHSDSVFTLSYNFSFQGYKEFVSFLEVLWFHFSHCNYDPVWIQFIFQMATHLSEQYLLNSLTSPH